mgnify:CR=1 FL=1
MNKKIRIINEFKGNNLINITLSIICIINQHSMKIIKKFNIII